MSEDQRTLWVGNLHEKVTNEFVYELFLQELFQLVCKSLARSSRFEMIAESDDPWSHPSPSSYFGRWAKSLSGPVGHEVVVPHESDAVICHAANLTKDIQHRGRITGPIDRVVFPTDGEGENKKNIGHAYVIFKHPESVHFASQVLKGTALFDNVLDLKSRSLPITYRSAAPSSNSGSYKSRFDNSSRFDNNSSRFDNNSSRFDNNSLRSGFNRSSTWHGRDDFAPRGRTGGNYRNRMGGGGGGSNYNQHSNGSYNTGYNNQSSSYNSSNHEDKRQRLLQQQNITLQSHQQQQQQPQQQQQNMSNMYGTQQQSAEVPQQQQQQQQQQNWSNNAYSTATGTEGYTMTADGSWGMMQGSDGTSNQAYVDQYGNWYQQQASQ